MTNEWAEFLDYTGAATYAAATKSDTFYLGRFTFDTLLDFEGMARVLTIPARGVLFHRHNGELLIGDPRESLEDARRSLCAWCSLPQDRKTAVQEAWRLQTDFSSLHEKFSALVEENGAGWFYRHVHAVANFALGNPQRVRKNAVDKAQKLKSGFDVAWQRKLVQYQIPIFSPQTKGAWTLRFDDVLADALELGALRREAITLPSVHTEKLTAMLDGAVPVEMVETLMPITLPIASMTATGWCCRWPILMPTLAIAALAESICLKSRRKSSNALTRALGSAATGCYRSIYRQKTNGGKFP